MISRVINITKNTVIAEKVEVANTTPKRIKGLLGRDGLDKGQALVIIPCSSIHTFFMKFSIDVLFVNNKGKAVAIAHSLPPNRLFGSYLKGKYVVELSPGTLFSSRTEEGDIIQLSEIA